MVSRRQWVLQFSANAKPGLYLIVTLVLTWIFEFAAVALGDRLSDWGVLLVASPALLVPPLVAIAWKPATLTREKYIAQPVVRNGESRH